MEILDFSSLSQKQRQKALQRPAMTEDGKVRTVVGEIVSNIIKSGDTALREYSLKLDKYKGRTLELTEEQIDEACKRVDKKLRKAIDRAYKNIKLFHKSQQAPKTKVETVKGVVCEVRTHAIDRVGLYVPGGSAPLVSTALMLAVPARIAGCKEIILCSPPPIDDAIIYAARRAGVRRIFCIGGAQAVAAMAYGTKSVPKVDKIFGPGNQYVTMAKRLVSEDPNGAAIDMPAGPSEVLVIADKNANPVFVASDLLSQAEHGPDSQVILLSDSKDLLRKVNAEIVLQLKKLPRAEIAKKSLAHSRSVLCSSLGECAEVSNLYAPEHLILQTKKPRSLLTKIRNAGSVFLGAYTPESLGDYAAGPNHTLPTYGYARTASALGTDDYRRRYTVSCASKKGLAGIARTVEELAAAEHLIAHKNAVSLRIKDKKQ